MQLPTISTLLLLPLLAIAESSTTTLTSTATMTKTITVSQVIASVTSTYPAHNLTSVGPTAYSTGAYTTSQGADISSSTAAPISTHSGNYIGAASSLNAMYAGSASLAMMIAAALL